MKKSITWKVSGEMIAGMGWLETGILWFHKDSEQGMLWPYRERLGRAWGYHPGDTLYSVCKVFSS